MKKTLTFLGENEEADEEKKRILRRDALVNYLRTRKIEAANLSVLKNDQLREMLESVIGETEFDQIDNNLTRSERMERLDDMLKKIKEQMKKDNKNIGARMGHTRSSKIMHEPGSKTRLKEALKIDTKKKTKEISFESPIAKKNSPFGTFSPTPNQISSVERTREIHKGFNRLLDEMNIDKQDLNVVELKIEAQKKIEFFEKLREMSERVKTFNDHFNSRRQRHEVNF